jgi:hypothetical protein
MRREYEPKIAVLGARVKELEQQQSLEAKFFQMERRLDLRAQDRDEVKRGSDIPQSEGLVKIDSLQRQIDDLKKVADPDARFRELAERVGELEKTNSLEARFTKLANEARGKPEIQQGELLVRIDGLQRQVDELKSIADLDVRFRKLAERVGEFENTNSREARFAELAHELKRGSEIPQGELLEKFGALQRQVDEFKSVADLDGCFRELAERVGELEKTNRLEARFAELAHEVKRESEIPQGECLAKIEGLQRQIGDLKNVADLDARFRELAERIGELEKTNSLEARFTKFADEVKRGSELPQSEVLARIDGLQRQLDDLKKVRGQPGPQGPPGPPGKLPFVKEYAQGHVHYESDVVTDAGALWQARCDTVHAPPHSDWICIARAGRNGSDGRSPNPCGTYDFHETYKQLDIVALDGAAFIAQHDNPSICPGDGWQLLSRSPPGRRGETGQRGVRGEKGSAANLAQRLFRGSSIANAIASARS